MIEWVNDCMVVWLDEKYLEYCFHPYTLSSILPDLFLNTESVFTFAPGKMK